MNEDYGRIVANVSYVFSGVLAWASLGLLAWFWYGIELSTIAICLCVVAVVLSAIAWRFRSVAHVVPLWGEYVRLRRLFARRRGNKWLRETGLVSRSDSENYPAFMCKRDGNMTVELGKVPVSDSDVQRKARDYVGNFGARRFNYSRAGDFVTIVWYANDPLDEVATIDELPDVDVRTMSVPCMRGDNGDILPLTFNEVSGVVVSGMPGTGKSVSMSVPFRALDMSPDVSLTVLDCKGGADWHKLSDVVKFSPTHSELDNAKISIDVVGRILDDMKQRYADGITQFWTMPHELRPPFRVLVVDESQELFEATTDPQLKKERAKLTAMVSALVKKGRAAGVCVVLMSQKQTSDAIPTTIRDNSTMKIAFRLATAEAVKSALGRDSERGEASPLEIPIERRGGAVVEIDGIRKHVRFMSVPDGIAP